MRHPKLGLLAVPIIVIACTLAPPASASFTCTSGRATCVITLTATTADPARSGTAGLRFTSAGGLIIETCTDLTISSDPAGGRDVARTGANNITFTGANITITGCSLNVDPGCTDIFTVTAGDSRWTTTLSASPRGATSYSTGFSIGGFRSAFTTCRDAGNNGTLTIAGQGLGTTCARYTATQGILTLTSCRVAYTSTVPNIPPGNATFSVSFHATVDGTAGPQSPTISNDP